MSLRKLCIYILLPCKREVKMVDIEQVFFLRFYRTSLVNKGFIVWHKEHWKNDLRTCLFSSTEKEASYLQKWRRVSVFSFSSSIPTEKLQKIFLLSRKIFVKENFRAPASTSAKCYCGNKTGNPERALSLHLARSGSQSQRRIWFILPARGACQILKVFIPLCRCVELCIVSMICNYA